MKRAARVTAFTLIEGLITTGIVATAGTAFFWVIYGMSVLQAKNEAVNMSHEEARQLMTKAVQQIHSSASIPQLVNTSLATVAGNGPAAGVRYQVVMLPVGMVAATAASGQNTMSVYMPSGTPAVGMRVIVPGFIEEHDITAVTGSSPTYTLTFSGNLSSTITTTGTAPNCSPAYQAYCTVRSALVVKSGSLLYYPDASKSTNVTIAHNVLTSSPFSIPSGNTQYIQASFTTYAPNATSRGYQAINLEATITPPYRYDLTSYQ